MTIWQRIKQQFGYPVEGADGDALLREGVLMRSGTVEVLGFERTLTVEEKAALQEAWRRASTGTRQRRVIG